MNLATRVSDRVSASTQTLPSGARATSVTVVEAGGRPRLRHRPPSNVSRPAELAIQIRPFETASPSNRSRPDMPISRQP